jgi:selenocysteine lyase/cysteine desulfurase
MRLLSADCGRYMSQLYEEARQVVATELAAPPEHYAVIFTGSGATAGLDKLARALLPELQQQKQQQEEEAAAGEDMPPLPVVFIGPHEHHSNEVLWRERRCSVKVGERLVCVSTLQVLGDRLAASLVRLCSMLVVVCHSTAVCVR